MKKLTFILAFISSATLAQTLKTKDILLGSNLNLSFNVPDREKNNEFRLGFGLHPNAEFIVEDNLGINLGLGYNISSDRFKEASGSKTAFTINSNTFSARLGFKKYIFPIEKLGFHFGLEGQYFDGKTKYSDKINNFISQEGKSSFFNININTGILYAMKNNLFLSAQVSFLSFTKEIKTENLKVSYDLFQGNLNNPVSIGIKKLIRK